MDVVADASTTGSAVFASEFGIVGVVSEIDDAVTARDSVESETDTGEGRVPKTGGGFRVVSALFGVADGGSPTAWAAGGCSAGTGVVGHNQTNTTAMSAANSMPTPAKGIQLSFWGGAPTLFSEGLMTSSRAVARFR